MSDAMIAIGNKNFIVEKLFYIPVKQVNPMYVRPYIPISKGEELDAIKERIESSRSKTVTPSVIAGYSNSILTVSPKGIPSDINRDWVSQNRFIFLMKVSSFEVGSFKTNYYIQGYTNYDGIGMNGAIDPNLTHYVNGIIETQVTIVNTPYGPRTYERFKCSYGVGVVTDNKRNLVFLQRPRDIIENINIENQYSHIYEGMGVDTQSDRNYVFNLGAVISPGSSTPYTSHVDNNIPSVYLSKILDSGLKYEVADTVFLGEENSRHNAAFTAAYEQDLSDNSFMATLSRVAGYSKTTSVFTFEFLSVIDRTIYDKFCLILPDKNNKDAYMAATPEVGERWEGQDFLTVKAYEVIESATALALKYGFTKLYFTSSNMVSLNAQPDIIIKYFNSFIELDDNNFTQLLELFKTEFMGIIFKDVTNNYILPVHLDIFIDIMSVSKLYINVYGVGDTWFTAPSYASSLYAPVITDDDQTLRLSTQLYRQTIEDITISNTSRPYHQDYNIVPGSY